MVGQTLRALPAGCEPWIVIARGRIVAVTGPGRDRVLDDRDALVPGKLDHAVAQHAAHQVDPDEIGDVAGSGTGPHLVGSTLLGDAAVLDDHDAVGERDGVDRIVRHDDAGYVEGCEVTAQIAAHLDPGRRVEGGERLVEQEQAGLECERPTERDALRLAAGELRWSQLRELGDPEALQPVHRLCVRFASPGRATAQAEGDVVDDAHGVEQEPVLEHHTDRSLARRHETPGRRVVEHLAVERDPSFVDHLQARKRPQQRRLPGAVRPDENDELTRFDDEVDIEIERAQPQPDLGVEPGLRHASAGARPRPASTRLPTTVSTRSETPSSTRLSTMPAGWLFSNAR